MTDQPRKFTASDLIINRNSQKEKYRQRTGEEKKSVHWGQRKLLLSEIEFFTLYWNRNEIPNPLCVYAGAAPGTHISLLSLLFPEFKFHLYDPRNFNIQPNDKISIFNEYFTNEVALRYAGRNDVFFVSDIRTSSQFDLQKEFFIEYGINEFNEYGDPIGDEDIITRARTDAQVKNEDQIWGDHLMQQEWVVLMNPEHAYLKFRLPYALGGINRILEYLNGVVYWQMWQPATSTETRLKPIRGVNGQYEVTQWSILDYEEYCFYHNIVTREKNIYLNPFTEDLRPIDSPELLNDYDSTAEAFILKMYYEKRGSKNIYFDVVNLSRYITQTITANHPNPVSLGLLRAAPVKSVNIRAHNAYRKTKGLKPLRKITNYKHSNVNINSDWRR